MILTHFRNFQEITQVNRFYWTTSGQTAEKKMSKLTKRKHVVRELLDEYVVPTGKQEIVKVVGGRGNNLHEVVDSSGLSFLVSMPTKFRKNVWIKRGDFVIVDPIEEGDKVRAEIVHILLQDHVRHIQQEGLWPKSFDCSQPATDGYIEGDFLPPSDSEEEDDLGLKVMKVMNANRPQQACEASSEEESEDDEEKEGEAGEEGAATDSLPKENVDSVTEQTGSGDAACR